MGVLPAGPAQRPSLIIGVMTYRTQATLQRRHTIRAFCNNATTPGVLLRFVMADADVDVSLGDVLVFQSPRNDRKLGTFLLTNRFFRYAVGVEADFIARADDDTAFDSSAIVHELRLLRTGLGARHIVYGPFSEWYIWDRNAMIPSCFDYSPIRWAGAIIARRSNTTEPLPRWQAECVKTSGVGPFMYAKGPFVAYSLSVARLIVGRLATDEATALSRSTRPLLDRYGVLTAPGKRSHPSRTIVYDDVYYSSLVFELYARRELLLVEAPFSEYVKERTMRLQPGPPPFKPQHFYSELFTLHLPTHHFKRSRCADPPQAQTPGSVRMVAEQ